MTARAGRVVCGYYPTNRRLCLLRLHRLSIPFGERGLAVGTFLPRCSHIAGISLALALALGQYPFSPATEECLGV